MTTPLKPDRQIVLILWGIAGVVVLCIMIWVSADHSARTLIRYQHLKEERSAHESHIAHFSRLIESGNAELKQVTREIDNLSRAPDKESAAEKESREVNIEKLKTRVQEIQAGIDGWHRDLVRREADASEVSTELSRLTK